MRINIFVVINQINKHKAKIYNQCTYTQIIIKKILLFFFTEYKNEWKQKKFRRKKNKKSDFYNNNNKKIFNLYGIDVNQISVSKKENVVNIIHLNTLLGMMIMMLLDHYV